MIWQSFTRCLVVVDTNALQLKITVAHIDAIAVDAMFLGNDLPELQERNGEMYNKVINKAGIHILVIHI